jgi:cell division septation protein DedD
MKASPNREQQLFLITGGVILLLILAVVIFNMVRSPTEFVEERVVQRPMVKLTDKQGRTDSYSQGSKAGGAAAVFGNHANNKELNYEKIKARTVLKPGETLPTSEQGETPPEAAHVLGGQTPDEKLVGGWNRSPADLEASRAEIKFREEEAKRQAIAAKKALAEKQRLAAIAKAAAEKVANSKAAIEAKALKARQAMIVAKLAQPTTTSAKKRADLQLRAEKPATTTDFSQAIANVVAKQRATEARFQQPAITHKSAVTKPPVRIMTKPAGSLTTKNGYSIQMVALSNQARANDFQDKLRAFMIDGKRMPVYQERSVTPTKTYYRVRLGPFSSRTKAERAERLIQQKLGMSGRLVKPSIR